MGSDQYIHAFEQCTRLPLLKLPESESVFCVLQAGTLVAESSDEEEEEEVDAEDDFHYEMEEEQA